MTPGTDQEPLRSDVLTVSNLSISFAGTGGLVPILKEVNFGLRPGEILGLVGESGSGKTTALMAVANYLPGNAVRSSGAVTFHGQDILQADRRELQAIWGRRIAVVYQDPASALNPAMRIGRQAIEVRLRHFKEEPADARACVLKLFGQMGLQDSDRIFDCYPHEISGGQRQRAMIAMALAGEPEILLMDEPTTALDVIIQKQLLETIRDLRTNKQLAVLFVSHDLGAVAAVADRVAFLDRGVLVESGRTAEILSQPRSDYARGLLAAVPQVRPKLSGPLPSPPIAGPSLEVRNLSVRYGDRGFLGRFGHKGVEAVRDITFTLAPGRVLAVVGESGSGKSTLGRAILGLAPVSGGTVGFGGDDVAAMGTAALRRLRRDVQMVFQNPTGSLNPRQRIHDIVARPLIAAGMTADKARAKAAHTLDAVSLPAAYLSRYPHHLSGGQKQRVAIARAFVTDPKLVILDEPTTALDVSVQASVLALLDTLKARTQCSYLFISHDLAVVSQMADDVLVLKSGAIVEAGPVSEVFSSPKHPYSRALLNAVVTV
jgi:peptide/nickel transport system ATP-binding protein